MTNHNQITEFAIYRDDGELMEDGWPTREEAETRMRYMYDPGEYEVRLILKWVKAEPVPFYRPLRFRSIAWDWLTRRPRSDWQPTLDDPNAKERWWRRG